MNTLRVIIIAAAAFCLLSCGSDASTGPGAQVIAAGTVSRIEASTFMYGTHLLLTDDARRYALRSTTVDLDGYVGKSVLVIGTAVPGYPVDGGPPYVDVTIVGSGR
jgi:hypothetical protein